MRPAEKMMMMGFTPISQMSRAVTMGIQQVASVISAVLARLNVGTAINATTAGRMPFRLVLKNEKNPGLLQALQTARFTDLQAHRAVLRTAPI